MMEPDGPQMAVRLSALCVLDN